MRAAAAARLLAAAAAALCAGRAAAEVNGVNAMVEDMFAEYASLPCVRAISKDGAVGCGSPRDVGVAKGGALFLVEELEDIERLAENQRGLDAVALVVDDALFDGAALRMIEELAANIHVAAVIVTVDENGSPQTPPRSSAAPTAWVPSGDGLLNETVSFVVTRLRDASQSEEIRALAAKNRDRGYADAIYQHSARYQFYLGKETATSPSCLTNSRCDPLGGLSVWALAGPLALSASKETVLLATNLDANSIFHDVVPARDTTASGVAAVLLAATAIAGVDESVLAALPRQIAAALFNGEAWSRAGSRRFVRDISLGGCTSLETANPYNGSTCADPPVYALAWKSLGLGTLSDVVSVTNVAGNSSAAYYAHVAQGATSVSAATTLTDVASASTDVSVSVTAATSTGSLPPSPLDSFVAAETETGVAFAGAGLVVAGFESAISETNPRYSSRYDRRSDDATEALTAGRIADVATLVARHAFVRAGGSVADAVTHVTVDGAHAAELWDCLTKEFACDLVAGVLGAASQDAVADFMASTPLAASAGVAGGPPSFFSGVYNPFQVENNNMKPVPLFARDYLAQFGRDGGLASTPAEDSPYLCSKDLDCMALTAPPSCALGRAALACLRGQCVCSNAFFHDAVSPALVYIDGGFVVNETAATVDDGLWTEPRWADGLLTLYLSANSSSTTIALLVSGVVLTASCAYMLRKARTELNGTKFKLT